MWRSESEQKCVDIDTTAYNNPFMNYNIIYCFRAIDGAGRRAEDGRGGGGGRRDEGGREQQQRHLRHLRATHAQSTCPLWRSFLLLLPCLFQVALTFRKKILLYYKKNCLWTFWAIFDFVKGGPYRRAVSGSARKTGSAGLPTRTENSVQDAGKYCALKYARCIR